MVEGPVVVAEDRGCAMRSYSRLGWTGLALSALFALWAFGAGIWMLDTHPDSRFGLLVIGVGVFVLSTLPVDSVLYARGMSEEEKANELVRATNSRTVCARRVADAGLRLLLRPSDDDPERPRQPGFAVFVASLVVCLFALIGFWIAVTYPFFGGSGVRFMWVWLGVSPVALLGAAVLIPRRRRPG